VVAVRLVYRVLNILAMVALLWLVVALTGTHSFFAPWLHTLYSYYSQYGFWPPDLFKAFSTLLSGSLLNLHFLSVLGIATVLCILFFWLSFHFGYLIFCAIGAVRELPEYLPSISVLLPALNEENYIGETLDALLRSNYPMDKLEIIVIASGSTDRTADIAQERASRGPVKVLTQPLPRPGKPAALHLGLSHARNDVVVIMDAESRVDPDTLRQLVKPLQQPDVVAAQGRIQVANADVNKLTRAQALEYAWFSGGGLYQEIFQKRNRPFFLIGRNYCVRRKTLLELDAFSGHSLTEDIRLTFQLVEMEGRIVFVPQARVWEEVPTSWEVLRQQRIRWGAGWNLENKRYLQTTKNKRRAISGLLEFMVVANLVAFFPIFGPIVGLIFLFLGEWLVAAAFFLPALFALILQAIAAKRYAGRLGLVTSFVTFARLYWMMFTIATRAKEIPEEWVKTDKDAYQKAENVQRAG